MGDVSDATQNNSDSPIFEDKTLGDLINKSIRERGTPALISDIMYHIYKDLYRPTDNKEIYYGFENHKWAKNEKIYDEIIGLTQYYDKVIEHNEGHNDIVKSCNAIKDNLRRPNYINDVLKIFRKTMLSRTPNIEKVLDTKIHLTGFDNGVYDMSMHVFRDAQPDDYISISVGYDYIDEHTKYFDELKKFVEDIQPNKEERDYMMTAFSLGIMGSNNEELMHIMTGDGRNGKSKMGQLLSKTFGEYYTDMAASAICREQPNGSTPRPELIDLKNKRMVLASEPEGEHSKMNTSYIKLLTGNDGIKTRNLYQSNMQSFVPCFSLYLLCNEVPTFDKNDFAIWSRCRCIEFPTVFKDCPDPSIPTEKLIDKNINNKLIHWRQDMMLWLIEYYIEYEKNGLKPTKNILRFTKEIRAGTDVYQQYFNDNVCIDEKSYIYTRDLYESFKTWHKANYQYAQTPSNQKFSKSLKNVGYKAGPIGKNNIYGIKGFKFIVTEKELNKDVFDGTNNKS